MNFADKKTVEKLRKEFPVGCRIVLDEMDDRQAPTIGTQGTCNGVDDAGNILVSWDTGIEWMKNLPAGRDGTVAFLNEVTEEHCKAFLLSITIHSPLKFTVHWFDDTKTEVEMDSNIEDYRNTASYYDGHTMRDGSQRKRHVR